MDAQPDPTSFYSLTSVTRPGIAWDSLRRDAIVAGRGHSLAPDEERIALTDELLARCIPELIQLAKSVALAGVPTLTRDCQRSIERSSAALIRLLDCALAAHGRDQRYAVDIWRERTETRAHLAARDVSERRDDDPWPLPDTINSAAHDIADALLACHRERMAVPEHITNAAADLLVVYAAMVEA